MATRIFNGVRTARRVLVLILFGNGAEEPAESAARIRSRLIYQIVRPEQVADPLSLAPVLLPQPRPATPRATTDLSEFRDRVRPLIAGAVQWSRAAVRVAMGAAVASFRVAVSAASGCGFYAKRFKQPILAGAALTATVAIVAGGIWTLRAKVTSPSAHTPTGTSATTQSQQDAVVPLATSVKGEPAPTSDPRRQTRSLTAAAAEPKSSRAASPSAGSRPSRSVKQRAATTVDTAVRPEAGAIADRPEWTPPPVVAVAERPESTPSPAVAAAPHIATTGLSHAPMRVYKADDTDVAPPTPVNDGQTQGLALARARDIGTIEVIIDEKGRVASAKAVVRPRTISESIEQAASLQAIKSWRFQPALKDGTPVRYLQVFAR